MFLGGLTIAINGFTMVFDVTTIAFNGFLWFRTIGQTMRWFRWIVVVYNVLYCPTNAMQNFFVTTTTCHIGLLYFSNLSPSLLFNTSPLPPYSLDVVNPLQSNIKCIVLR